MAISFSRPDPSSPAAVADATFGTSRRGYDHQEVRDFLRMVAAELSRLQERERFLERELRASQSAPSWASGQGMDEEMATRLLGEEAAHILQAAREGGVSIRAKAEDGAAKLLREAAEESQRVREDAELEASRRRTDAAADAEAELAMAKQQGREMVEEARAYRERVLSELSRRRELARQQIEQLLHGRDRLLQAFEQARLAAADVVAEITPLGPPEDLVDLSPTTGPIPLTMPQYATAHVADQSSVDDSLFDDTSGFDDQTGFEAPPAEIGQIAETAEIADDGTGPLDVEATVLSFPAVDANDVDDAKNLDDVDDVDDVDDESAATDIDDLFARLRADRPTADEPDLAEPDLAEPEHAGEEDAATTEGTDVIDETPFRRRDAALVPLIVASARKLKRVLADEQNEVLDALRNREPVGSVDGLLVDPADQAARYVDAVAGEVLAAVEAGAATTTAGGEAGGIDRGPGGPLDPVRAQLVTELVAPLRERLARAVADGDGDNEVVAKRARGVYREWKTQRIDEQLDDVFRTAYCHGALAAAPTGSHVAWIVDPDGPPSPDCEDNALAGAVVIGDAFPSGHVTPPMDPGCRCLLTTVDG
ncbi:MAG: DivIVA domain-containing protein [Ilumatobacteraceae bacterium]